MHERVIEDRAKQVIAQIEQQAWDDEIIRFRHSKREAFRNVLKEAFDVGRRMTLEECAAMADRDPRNMNEQIRMLIRLEEKDL